MVINKITSWRAARGGKGISKAHLARRIGMTRSYMTKLEQGKLQPSASVMFKLADYFQCKIEDIFQYQPDKDES